jgi:hypothetical protein
MASFTGAGIFQGFQQSCVPTSFQIAIAEMDPVAAAEMRDDPTGTIGDQRDALAAGGGGPTRRTDLASGKDIPARVRDALAETPELDAAMRPDKSAEGGSFYGMEATKMVGGDLHQQLEGEARHPAPVRVGRRGARGLQLPRPAVVPRPLLRRLRRAP